MAAKGDKLVLLDCWVSPFCMRVRIALKEKGIAFEEQEESLFGGKSDLLFKSNPIYAKVPVLLHNEKAVCESSIIVGYVDDTWPSPPLLPSSAYDRSLARFWVDYIDKKLFDATRNLAMSKGEEQQEGARSELKEVLKVLEGALGEKDYFGGDKFGFVDIIAIPITSWFVGCEKFGNFNVDTEFPKFSAWIKRCMRRESVTQVIPESEKILGFVTMFRKMQGID